MITLLIVDDEEFAISYLCKSIDFLTLGITNILKTTDSKDAIEIAKLNKVDILMTDINMPVITGIDLSTKIKSFSPDCRIIFMSGYSEKEYYKSAIKLGVSAYIEKPFNIPEICETLKENAEKIKQQKSSDINNEIFKKTVKKDITLELTKTISDYEIFRKKLSVCNLDNLEQSFIVSGLIKFIPKNEATDYISVETLIHKSISNIKNTNIIYAFKQDNLLLFHLFGNKEFSTDKNLIDSFNILTEKTSENYNTISSFGMAVSGVKNAYNSYQDAVTKLEAGFIIGYNNPVIKISSAKPYTFPENYMQSIAEGINMGNMELVAEIINELFNRISQFPCTPTVNIKNRFLKIINKINDTLNISEEYAHIFSDTSKLIQNANTLSELKEIMNKYINNIHELNAEKHSPAVKKALSYIHQNYNSNVFRLKDIGNHTAMNTSYICTLFKNEIGDTINGYLVKYRVKKAQELLINTNETIESVAKNVGYTDSKHFFKIFKKEVGMTPSQYRKKFNRAGV